jgi:hypothetical protein
LWFDPFSLLPSIPAVKLSSDLIYVAIRSYEDSGCLMVLD